MEKRIRSSIQVSAEEFLLSAKNFGFQAVKPSLKTIIWNINASSELSCSLPLALHQSISRSIESFKQLLNSHNTECAKSPHSPVRKRIRRSSRQAKNRKEPNEDPERQILEDIEIDTHITVLCISHPKKVFSSPNLLPSARALHDNLILFEKDPILQSNIASLCEDWWKEQLPDRETLVCQSLPVLLSRSFELGKKVDVRRVYALREAFSLLDFEDESIEDLKLLLLRCIITPLYLKTEEGRRFAAFSFGLSGQLVKEALAVIRSQIPFGRKSMLEAYADIIFRAWKAMDGSLRGEIENDFMQSLIEGAIYASSGSFAASIRRVLGGFINQRTTAGVEKLLFRLTEPVLFRSLLVANSNVRQNALHLLLDMFPLEDPDATKEVKDTLLNRQFFLLERLLIDDCPDVRVIAVEGCCRVLHLFWEIIPSSIITKLITKIVDDMSSDTSYVVRVSTLHGIIYLLGNPQAHEILKVLLPRLGHLFLDCTLSVRVAMTDLLLVLRNLRGFQFNKVVSFDVLLNSLASDQPPVAQKITKLLIPSYCPSNVTCEEACNLCVKLIKRSPMAGARFCEFALSEGASLTALMELVSVFVHSTLSPNDLNADQVEGVLVAAANLCHCLINEASCKAALKELFSGGKLKCLFNVATTGRAQTSVLRIASFVSPDDVDSLFKECMGLIINCSGLAGNVERQAKVRSAHKLVLCCGWFDDMFQGLTNILQKVASMCCVKFGIEMPKQLLPSVKQKKTKSSVKISQKWKHVRGKKSYCSETSNFEENYAIAAAIAWQIKDLLVSVDTRNAVLKSQLLQLAFSTLKVISEVSIEQCVKCEYSDASPLLAYMSLALHMTLQGAGLPATENNGHGKNNGSDTRSSKTELDQSLEHVVDCTEKLFGSNLADESGELHSKSMLDDEKMTQKSKYKHRKSQSDHPCPNDHEANYCTQKKISSTVKMVTSILKFIVDAITTRVVSHSQQRCLRFTSAYMQYIISILREHFHDKMQSREKYLKEIFICLKSCFTYATKLLNLALSNSSDSSLPATEASNLANDLLDLIALTESYLDSGYATQLFTTAKPWLPDLILALGSGHILTKSPNERVYFNASGHAKHPSWITILGKVENYELRQFNRLEDDEESESILYVSSVLKKLRDLMILTLKGKVKILDAVGAIFLAESVAGLEREDYGLVLAMVHFVCVKLLSHEEGEWKQLEEESNIVSDLADPEKKAIEDLKQLIQEALNKHEFTAPPPPPAAPEEEKKTETEETPAPAPAPAEEKVAAEEAPALVVTEEPPKVETSGVVELALAPEVVTSVDDDGTKIVEANEQTIIVVSTTVAPTVELALVEKEAEGEAATAAPAETKKEEITDAAAPPEEVSIWGVPLLVNERRDAILLKFLREFKV
ncbi:hypothetical protein NE237_016955 [Protea cynaroides]|uniref:Uncharacterized protein n=1 Tax=Protea cynaroides TaxID=273540 RepID=A0A9Q0HEI0_9MAGN|nr:hypothetical protein NE237_016955 [Protea cynaroides]